MNVFVSGRKQALGVLALALLLVPALATAQQDEERSYTISPNERIHVIQQKVELLGGRWEATVYPLTAQLNSRWTQHLGVGLAGAYHLSDTFAIQGLVDYNAFMAEETDLQTELREKAQLQPATAPTVLTEWYGAVALEMSPIYGKLAFYEDAMLHFSLVLNAGLGAAGTKVQIIPRPSADVAPEDAHGPAFASAGIRPAGLLGAGFRVHLPGNWMLRAEVRDLFFSTRVTRLNGCTREELATLGNAGSPDATLVSASCNVGAFTQDEYFEDEVQLAEGRADGSADTVNQISAYIGFSHLF